MSIKIWNSTYPVGIDTTGSLSMPDLINNRDLSNFSQAGSIRNALISLETIIGSDAYESGSIRYRLNNLTFDDIYNNQSGIRTINVNDQPISFYGNKEIRFDGGPIRLSEQGSDPIDIDNYGFIYVKHIDGYSELSYLDNYGNILQISNKGYSTDPNAIHKNIDSEISSIISAIPTSSDYLLIEDADDSNNKKSINISDIIPLTTKGDIFTYNSTTWDRLSVGTNGYILSADSSESTGLKWIENVSGSDPNAIHVNIFSEISSLSHVTPVGSDYLLIEDADDSNNKKSISISGIVPLTTKGDIFAYNSTTWDRLPIGPNGYLLSSDSSESTGLKWIEISSFDINAIHKNIGNEISLITSANPTGSDYLLIEDADDSNNKKSINISDIIPLTTKGDIFTYNSTTWDRLSVGTNGYILSADSSESTGLKWIEDQQDITNISDEYAYLYGVGGDPEKVDDYGIIYAKQIDNYGNSIIGPILYYELLKYITFTNNVFDYNGSTAYDGYLYFTSYSTIYKHNATNFELVDSYSSGILGVEGITNDGTYLYFCDSNNDRVKKHLMSNWSYIDDVFVSSNIKNITNDGTYLYVTDGTIIKKYLMSNLSFNTASSSITGTIRSITTDSTYVYVTESDNSKIMRFLASNLSFVDEYSSGASFIVAFVMDGYFYDAGYVGGGLQVRTRLLSDLTIVDTIEYGNDNSHNICGYGGFLYVQQGTTNIIILKTKTYVTEQDWEQFVFNEFYYLDDYDGYTQISNCGVVPSYIGHSIEASPVNPTGFDDEWKRDTLDPKWSFDSGFFASNKNVLIKNNHAIIQNSSGDTDPLHTYFTAGVALVQDAPVDSDFIVWTSLKTYSNVPSYSNYSKCWAGLIIVGFENSVIFGHYQNTYEQGVMHMFVGKVEEVGSDSFLTRFVPTFSPVIGIKYNQLNNEYTFLTSLDSECETSLVVDASYSLNEKPLKMGIYAKTKTSPSDSSLVTATCCEWFRVKLL